MGLPPGGRVGPYDVVAAIGSGGMGEVYRARDTKLQRDVALKVLPDHFASDPERLAHFRRGALWRMRARRGQVYLADEARPNNDPFDALICAAARSTIAYPRFRDQAIGPRGRSLVTGPPFQ